MNNDAAAQWFAENEDYLTDRDRAFLNGAGKPFLDGILRLAAEGVKLTRPEDLEIVLGGGTSFDCATPIGTIRAMMMDARPQLVMMRFENGKHKLDWAILEGGREIFEFDIAGQATRPSMNREQALSIFLLDRA